MTQIVPKFENIRFSTSNKIYSNNVTNDSYFVKQEQGLIALISAFLNKIFGTKSITEKNIGVVVECAVKNLNNIECTIDQLIAASKIIDEMIDFSKDNNNQSQLQVLKEKVDTKLISTYYEKNLPQSFHQYQASIETIRNGVNLDFPRASDCYFNGQDFKAILPQTDSCNYSQKAENSDIATKALLLANFQSYENPRTAIGYLFNLGKSGKIKPLLKREYAIKNISDTGVTVSVQQSWSHQENKLIDVNYDIVMNKESLNEIFKSNNDSNKALINPIISTQINSVNITDRDLFNYHTA